MRVVGLATGAMQGMSERQYAAHAGVSRGAVQKARAAGRLVLFPDGSIDARASDIRRAATTDPSKQRARSDRASRLKPVPEAALGSVRETLKEQGLPAGGNVTFVQARTAHEIAKAHLARLKLQERRGELVDRARATALVFRLAREERDSWLNWPARIAALMAAELGVEAHPMQKILEMHVRAHLAELAEVKPAFR
ncbi:MAG: hypothetical protein BroJett024_42160 [Alphaproteobacteria bacterium]|nr:MAG: hypothetical protein BroJett024_42160 [Alphaproteobacteria bacterium]